VLLQTVVHVYHCKGLQNSKAFRRASESFGSVLLSGGFGGSFGAIPPDHGLVTRCTYLVPVYRI
jgi:hypothetical protein